jgi:hypothetical protein
MGQRIGAMDTTTKWEAKVYDMGWDRTFKNNYGLKCRPYHHIGCDA